MAAASDLEGMAKGASVDDGFELAIELCTLAFNTGPTVAVLYADQAQACISSSTQLWWLFCAC